MAYNRTLYKNLKQKVLNKRQSEYKFDQTLQNISASLFPRDAQQNQEADTSAPAKDNTAALQKDMNAKLAAQKKYYDSLMQKSDDKYSESINALQSQVASGQKRSLQISESLQNAINKLAKRDTQGQTQPQTSQPATNTGMGGEGRFANFAPVAAVEEEEEEEEKKDEESTEETTEDTTETTPVKKVIQKATIGQHVPVGNYTYKVTNVFGMREGANAVRGREGQHSRGIDVVGFNEHGKRTNAPISLTNGEIIEVGMQGDGSKISPTEGSSGGAYLRVRLPDGKVGTYMHLDKRLMGIKDQLVGKNIRRGQLFFNPPEGSTYYDWSGSGTGAKEGNTGHVKFSVSTVGEDGKLLLDHDKNNAEEYLF